MFVFFNSFFFFSLFFYVHRRTHFIIRMQSNNNNHIQNHNASTNNKNWHSSSIWQRSTAPTSIGNILSSSPSLPTLPPVQSRSPSRYTTTTNHLYQPYSALSRSSSSSLLSSNNRTKPPTRPRLTTTLWEDESTLCYQVDSRGICVARRQGKTDILLYIFKN